MIEFAQRQRGQMLVARITKTGITTADECRSKWLGETSVS